MTWRELRTRLRFLVFRKSARELDEELQFHLEQSMQRYLATGMDRAEARRQALVEFGGIENAREETHRQRPSWFLETLLQDVRYALRGFRRNPAFTLTVIATLALGIGATTAVFSVVDRILFRSLPYAHADRLVSVGITHSLEKEEFMFGGFYYEWRDNQRPFEAMAAQSATSDACSLVESNPIQLNCANAEAGFLPLLGISPALGRNFLPEEDRPGGPRVALISYGLWKSRFALDPGALNRLFNLDGNPVRIIGVLPRDFELPTLQPADVLMPMAFDEAKERKSAPSPGHPMRTFARLRPGVNIAQARAAMEPLFTHTLETFIPPPYRGEVHFGVRSLRDRQTQEVQLAAWVLFGAVLAVLLIACANIASLMMARGAARERELAVRSALGASRGRLIGQTLTEALLLAFAGAVAGLALAGGLLRLFVVLAPTGVPFLEKAHLDLRIAIFSLLLSFLCGAFFGLIPALQKPRPVALATRSTHSGRQAFLRRSMVVGQIAISMILLSGAMLLLRSFANMANQNLGIQAHGVLTARISVPGFQNSVGRIVSRNGQKQMEFFARVETAVRRLPGIRAVGWSESLPPGGGFQDGRRFAEFHVEGKPAPVPGTGGQIRWRGVTPDYFRALNIPILRGQNFTEKQRDSTQQWVILSRLAASQLFPNADPGSAVGRRLQMVSDGSWFTVAGVAANIRNGGLSEEDEPEIDWLRRNVPSEWGTPIPYMILETDLSPEAEAPWIRAAIAQLDPTVPVEMETLSNRVSTLADRPRFETALLGFFALMGLLMAVVGLYGLTAYLATQRTQEIGIRMALGADRENILRLIAGEGMRLIALGGLLGLAASLGVTQVLRSLLFGVSPRDPLTFVAVVGTLSAVALAATLIPAQAAMRVDPMEALRCE